MCFYALLTMKRDPTDDAHRNFAKRYTGLN
jgi:hypothetical protein